MSDYLYQVSGGLGAVTKGETPDQRRDVLPDKPGIKEHHDLAGLVPVYQSDNTTVSDYNDDHTQYALLPGRVGGQELFGSRDAGVGGSIAALGEFAQGETKITGGTWSAIAVGNTAAIGNVVLAVIATHNVDNGTGLGGGATNGHTAMSDTAGNTWTKLKEWTTSFFYAPGAGGTMEQTVSLWVCYVTATMTAGVTTLSATFNAACIEQTLESHRFSIPANTTLGIAASTQGGTADADANPGSVISSLSLSGLTGEVLWFRATAVSNEATTGSTTFTPTSGFTSIYADHNASTLNGVPEISGIGARGEFKINMAGSATSAPFVGTRFADDASVFLGFQISGAVGYLNLASADVAGAAVIELDGATIDTEFDYLNFLGIHAPTILSYIRGTDGAFVGPVVLNPKQHLLTTDLFDDVLAGTVTRGNVLIGNSTPKWAPLSLGTAGKVLHSDGTDAAWATLAASEVSNTPAGNIAATTVQAALNELDTEKVRFTTATDERFTRWSGTTGLLVNAPLYDNGNEVTAIQVRVCSDVDDTYDLGKVAPNPVQRWKNIYFSGVLSDGTNSATAAQLRDATKIQGTAVTITGPLTSGDILQYNGTAWVDRSLSEAGISGSGHTHSLTDLTDVDVTGANTGDYLRKSAGDWVDVSISQVLTDLKTVDGSTSGLDADLLDGLDSTAFAAALSGTSGRLTRWTSSTTIGASVVATDDGTDISPVVDATSSFGTTTARWKNLWLSGNLGSAAVPAGTLFAGSVGWTSGTKAIATLLAGSLSINAIPRITTAASSAVGASALSDDSTHVISSRTIRPSAAVDLGATANKWVDVWFSGAAKDGTDTVTVAQMRDATKFQGTALTITGPLTSGDVLQYSGSEWVDRSLAESGIAAAGAAPAAHQLDGALHTVSGLATGTFLKALSATTFGFAVHGLTNTDVGAAATSHVHALTDLSGGTVGQYIRHNGTNWAAVALSQVFTDIKTVDGTGTGLDADLLDGLDSTAFSLSGHGHGSGTQNTLIKWAAGGVTGEGSAVSDDGASILVTSRNLKPSAGTQELGGASAYWNKTFSNYLAVGSLGMDVAGGGVILTDVELGTGDYATNISWVVTSKNPQAQIELHSTAAASPTKAWLEITAGAASTATIRVGDRTTYGQAIEVSHLVYPTTDDAVDLGTNTGPNRFRHLYLTQNLTDGSNSLTVAQAKTAYTHSQSTHNTGSGTTNKITKWSGTNVLGDTVITDDGTDVSPVTTAVTSLGTITGPKLFKNLWLSGDIGNTSNLVGTIHVSTLKNAALTKTIANLVHGTGTANRIPKYTDTTGGAGDSTISDPGTGIVSVLSANMRLGVAAGSSNPQMIWDGLVASTLTSKVIKLSTSGYFYTDYPWQFDTTGIAVGVSPATNVLCRFRKQDTSTPTTDQTGAQGELIGAGTTETASNYALYGADCQAYIKSLGASAGINYRTYVGGQFRTSYSTTSDLTWANGQPTFSGGYFSAAYDSTGKITGTTQPYFLGGYFQGIATANPNAAMTITSLRGGRFLAGPTGNLSNLTTTEVIGTEIDIQYGTGGTITRAYGLRINAPTGSVVPTNAWGANIVGDLQIASDKYLILEGDGTTKGDTRIRFNSATTEIEVDVNATKTLQIGPAKLGFYGTTAITKPAVTGSKVSGAALASLLTTLANLGLITDSTSA